MQLPDEQVTTAAVKRWRGLHLLHFQGSSCSQKVRMLLGEKQLDFASHPINLPRNEHVTPWFLGINPRGVVPVLVHDGAVHIESNDIMAYADTLPSSVPSFFPVDEHEREHTTQSLALEDSLHVDLRNLTMGFLFPPSAAMKSRATLRAYGKAGAADPSRDKEVAWWRAFSAHGGVTEDALERSLGAFHDAFATLDKRLQDHPWLIGDRISVLEIAWFVSVHRLVLAGYPIDRHAHLAGHYRRLLSRPTFVREVDPGRALRIAMRVYGAYRRARGTGLRDFASARLAPV